MPRTTPPAVSTSASGASEIPQATEDVRLDGATHSSPAEREEGVALDGAGKRKKQEEKAVEEAIALEAAEERSAELRAKDEAARKAAELKAGSGGPPKDIGPMPIQPKMEWAGKYNGGFSLADVLDALFDGLGNIKENKRRLGEYRDKLKDYYRKMDDYGAKLKTQIAETRNYTEEQGKVLKQLDQVHDRLASDREELKKTSDVIEHQEKIASLMESILPKDEDGKPRAFASKAERDAAIDGISESRFHSLLGISSDSYKEMRQKMKEMELSEFTPEKVEARKSSLAEQRKGFEEEIAGLDKQIAENEAERNKVSRDIKTAERLAKFNVANYVPQIAGAKLRGPGERGFFKSWRPIRLGSGKTGADLERDLGVGRMSSGITEGQISGLKGKLEKLKASAEALKGATEENRKELKDQFKRDAGDFTAEYAALRKFGNSTPEMKAAKRAALEAIRDGASEMQTGLTEADARISELDKQIRDMDEKIKEAKEDASAKEKLHSSLQGTEEEIEKARQEMAQAQAEVARLEAEKVGLRKERDDVIRGLNSEDLRDAHEIERDRKELKATRNPLKDNADPFIKRMDKLIAEEETKVVLAVSQAEQKLVSAQEELAKGIQGKVDSINEGIERLEEIDAQLKEKTDLVDKNKGRLTAIADSLKPGGPDLEADEEARLKEEKARLEEENRQLLAKDGPLHQLEQERERLESKLEGEIETLQEDPIMQQLEKLEETRDALNPEHAENPAIEAVKKGAKIAEDHSALGQSREARHDFNNALDKPSDEMRHASMPARPTGPGPQQNPSASATAVSEPRPRMLSQLASTTSGHDSLRSAAKTPTPKPVQRAVSSAPTTTSSRKLK